MFDRSKFSFHNGRAFKLNSDGSADPNPVFFTIGDYLLRNPVFYIEEVWRRAKTLSISSRTWLSRVALIYV